MMDIPKPQPKQESISRTPESGVAHFVKYNNTIPIVLGFIFLGATGTMAATPEVRQAVYSTNQRTISVDNSRILSVDPDTYPLTIQIRSVAEDDEKYYVRYTLTTLGLIDGTWTDTALAKELVVYKSALGERDLGTYVSGELAEVREYERRLLKDTQEIERTNGLSQKVVATTYSGLVGKYLSETTETISGYTPVTEDSGEAPPVGSDPNRLSNPVTSLTFDANAAGGPALTVGVAPSGVQSSPSGADTTAPEVSLLGDSPARVAIGGSYSDLGVASTDNVSRILRTKRFLNDVQVGSISISTAAEATYAVRYEVSDEAGNTTVRFRTIIVGGTSTGSGSATEPEPAAPSEPVEPTPAAPTPTPTPEPAPAPSEPAGDSEASESSPSAPEPSAAGGGESAPSGESSGGEAAGGGDSAPAS